MRVCMTRDALSSVLQCVAVCVCAAVCCSVLQCVAFVCSVMYVCLMHDTLSALGAQGRTELNTPLDDTWLTWL